MQRQILNSHRGLLGNFASRFSAILAMAGLLLLSACDGSSTVTENNLPEPGKDGVPPTLESVLMQPNGIVEAGDSVKITFVASEALMTPVVYINNVQAEVSGKIQNWSAVREMTEFEPQGFVTFSIVYQDVSGELGQGISETTDDSTACIGEECPREDELGPLEGNWQLDFAGVGPAAGDTTWFSISDTGPEGERYCWFNDTYQFGRDGSFRNVQGGETWVEDWQGNDPASCAAPVAPHDGSNNAIFEYDDVAATLQLTGQGAFLGLAKVFDGGELALPTDAPESVTYEVVELVGDSLTVRVNYGGGVWEYRLTRLSNLPIAGNWKLDFAGVGPAAGDTTWFSISDTGPEGERACWFDDTYHFGGDGSFQNFQGGETWVEDWQGTDPAACAAPVTPHDGSTAGTWYLDDAAGTVTLNGAGLFVGLAKVINGGELALPADAPGSVTYDVAELVGEGMTVRIDYGGGVWEFALVKE